MLILIGVSHNLILMHSSLVLPNWFCSSKTLNVAPPTLLHGPLTLFLTFRLAPPLRKDTGAKQNMFKPNWKSDQLSMTCVFSKAVSVTLIK